MFNTIRIKKEKGVCEIFLAREKVHNAFNGEMIDELTKAFTDIKKDNNNRIVVISGMGKSFCAGADLVWMKDVVNYSFDENIAESRKLSLLYDAIFTLPLPVIARVNGPAIGGGFGLVAVCDLILASEKSFFKLSEVKVGLVPAVISPYLLRKFGENRMRELFLLGNKISARQAFDLGFVHRIAAQEELDTVVQSIIVQLLENSPQALKACKELLFHIPQMNLMQAKEYAIDSIAKRRISSEGQEGMKSFLEKRKPAWVKKI
ncbi:enoyl-CoA hydratase-related protein [Candidatus Riflebacteria bacterium]